MEQVKDNGKTEQKWPREPILGVLGTNAISHLAGGGAPSSLGPKNTFLVFLPDSKAPDRQWGTAVKVELTDLQNILAGSFFLFVVMARIINTNVKQDTDIAAWKM